MNPNGRYLRQLTHNTMVDSYASWAHKGLDIVYRSGEPFKGKKVTLLGLNTPTGERLFDFLDFASATEHIQPVWAATQHVLIPSMRVVEAGQSTPRDTQWPKEVRRVLRWVPLQSRGPLR